MVRGGWVFRGAKGTDIDNGPLKFASCLIFFHFVGRGGKDARDAARASPGNDVVGTATGAEELGVRRRYVNFHAIIDLKSVRSAMLIKSFGCCLCHEGLVCSSHGVECLHGDAKGFNECGR